jgi:amidohydrolase
MATPALLSAFALACLLGSSVAAAAVDPAELERQARDSEKKLIEWRRDIHQNPELSNREVRTSKKVEAHLRSLGLDVKTGIAHTGVVAVLKGGKPGPVVALRADMDALPVTERTDVPFKSTVTAEYRGEKVGVMHACGHDAHVAILMAAAQVLTAVKKDLPGTILFIFQPAEEGVPDGETGGAKQMLAEGVLDIAKPEAVFGLHVTSDLNSGDVGYRSGPLMAGSDRFSLVVAGRQTHGANPWQGVDPIVTSAQIINSLQTVVSRQVDITLNPAIVTVGAIKGGIRHNIIPDDVQMVGTIRTFDKDQRADILQRVERIAKSVAEANGATATFTLGTDPNPVVLNDPPLTERVLPSLRRAVGEEHVKVLPLITGAEDFAFFAQRVPSVFFFVGVTPRGQDAQQAPANHSPLFYMDEAGLPPGLRSMLQVAVDYLQSGGRSATSSP